MVRSVLRSIDFKLVLSLACVSALSIGVSFFISWSAVVVLAIVSCAYLVCVLRPTWGVYALAFAAPMSGLAIDFSQNQSLARVPYIGSINAPLSDFIALLLLGALVFPALMWPRQLNWRAFIKTLPIFVVWTAACAASVYFTDVVFFGIAIKAFLRPNLFVYIGFMVPILLIVRSRLEIERAFLAYEIAALFGALLGFSSLVLANSIGFARVQPISIFGFAPFGYNHNVLAESLTAIIPFAWWWAEREKGERRNFGFIAASLITAASILTFSRAAWIVVTLQGACLLWWRVQHREHHVTPSQRRSFILVATALALAVVLFFGWIQNTAVAESSDATRKDLLGISVLYFLRAPWFGQGPGTFVPLVAETTAFRMDYVDPLDAHGIIQKLITEVGAIGFLVFVWALALVVCALWKRRRESFDWMLLVTVLSLWAYQLFNTGYFDAKVWVIMGLATAALLL